MLENTSSTSAVLPYKELERTVWTKDICAGCRGCITVCPSNTLAYDSRLNRPYQFTPCIDCKACLDVCPRMPANLSAISSQDVIGQYIEMASARSLPDSQRSQNGGAATALLTAALEEEFIDCALVMGSDRWTQKAYPRVVYYPEELRRSAGSKYDSNGVLESLKDVAKDSSVKNIAVTGTPCTIEAIRLLRRSSNEYAVKLSQKLRFALGLFCFESFDSSFIKEVTGKTGAPAWRILKMDACEGKLTVNLRDGETKALPLSGLSGYVKPGCYVCSDFTSKMADISIGSVGSEPGMSTVIVRTMEGMGLYQIARELNLLETSGRVNVAAIEKVGKLKLKRNGI